MNGVKKLVLGFASAMMLVALARAEVSDKMPNLVEAWRSLAIVALIPFSLLYVFPRAIRFALPVLMLVAAYACLGEQDIFESYKQEVDSLTYYIFRVQLMLQCALFPIAAALGAALGSRRRS